MSTERVTLNASPSSARIVAGDATAAFDALLVRERETAFAKGVCEGERRASQAAAGALAQACERLDRARETAVGQMTHDTLELTLEIARRLLRSEIAAGHYDMERIVREALSFSGAGRGACVVHLNPADAAALASVQFRAGTQIEADVSVARGDAHVTTPHGLLVREIDEALRAVGEHLREELA